jgi:signal-transduction protein with cAMP-binding, CBS, and nucleotidyltransferase domain
MTTAQKILSEKGGGIIGVPPETTVADTLRRMAEHKVGAIVVLDGETPIGIWTSRDLMRNILLPDFDPQRDPIAKYMQTHLKTALHTATAYEMMDKFLGLRVNHLLIEENGHFIGLLSSGDVMKAAIQEKTEELKSLQSMVSWEYYEEWRWKPPK